jgi:hypothetical protein
LWRKSCTTIKKHWMNKVKLVIIAFILIIGACKDPNENTVFTSFRGVFKCHENSIYSDFKSYLLEFDKVNSVDDQYIILNFHNAGDLEFVYAFIDGDTLRIENQSIQNMFVNGKGLVSDDFRRIDLVYQTDDGRVQEEFYAKIFR